ncbi:hypothetical protein R50072_30010 [Simiduia litorea]|uniref:ABC transporter substrate-binding protein n=1 Tax=Simiduia litorea TaxID=1435348 RepID=UPI0036F37589
MRQPWGNIAQAATISLICLVTCLTTRAWGSTASPLRIYLDADRTHNQASALAIERGLQIALDEVDNQIQGHPIELIPLDHRGNTRRSKLHMDKALADPNTLLIMAGLHSPPLIKYRDFINQNELLTLVPWAAGGPITRYPAAENWIFRLSVDDTKAGNKLANFATKTKGCKKPHLLLEQTPWGESNQANLIQAVRQERNADPLTSWFNWEVSTESARIMLRSIRDLSADCIIYVGNSRDIRTIIEANKTLAEPLNLPIISHWGITGGNFEVMVSAEDRDNLDLSFLQTCFSFISSKPTPLSTEVVAKTIERYADITSASDIKAPTGFIHAYDLGRLLIQALNQFELSDDTRTTRAKLRNQLENITTPVKGLIKTYQQPFRQYSASDTDAHEALGKDDLCMGRFTDNNDIELLP